MTKAEPGLVEEHLTLSDLLSRLAETDDGPLTVDEVIGRLGPRAFGAVLFIFAAPNLLPLPPGSSTVLGLPLLLIAPQLALGAKDPWLPRSVGRRTLDPGVLRSLCQRASPWVDRAERLTTRRLAFLFGRFGDLAIGVVCSLLAAVLILPIPLGNMLPAAAIAILALSLVQRDGLLALLGYATAGVSGAVLILSGQLVLASIARLGGWTGLW